MKNLIPLKNYSLNEYHYKGEESELGRSNFIEEVPTGMLRELPRSVKDSIRSEEVMFSMQEDPHTRMELLKKLNNMDMVINKTSGISWSNIEPMRSISRIRSFKDFEMWVDSAYIYVLERALGIS
jgi:hypothetical protein